jgi:hypothetical protein
LKTESLYILADWAAPLTRIDFAKLKCLEVIFWLEEKHFEQGMDKGYVIIAIEADSRDLWWFKPDRQLLILLPS